MLPLFFQKKVKHIDIKILYNKIRIIGPLGILENEFKWYNNINYLYIFFKVVSIDNIIVLSNKYSHIFFNELIKSIIGVQFGWFFSFNIYGRGFSFRLRKKNKIIFLKLKIGYSHYIIYHLNNNLLVKIVKKRNKLFVFGLNFWLISKFAYQLRSIRSKHVYKLQGVQFFDEKIIIKPGKKKQT